MNEPLAPAALSWPCPACGRRVPMRAGACHCGMTAERAAALNAAGPTAGRPLGHPAAGGKGRRDAALALWRSFPTDIKVLTVAAALVVTSGLGLALFWPGAPNRTVPVLGYVDSRPPVPKPSPTPGAAFKLPWWR